MHERKKLNEAKYFYSRIVEEEEENWDIFTYNLSAFLSAARSVLQYALSEAKTKTNGQAWYENYISARDILKFFRDKRDINIHTKPIRAQAQQTLKETVSLLTSYLITVKDKYGNIIQESSSDDPEPEPKESEVSKIKYIFDDWDGSEDVPELCQRYLQELESIIIDGVRKGFITG